MLVDRMKFLENGFSIKILGTLFLLWVGNPSYFMLDRCSLLRYRAGFNDPYWLEAPWCLCLPLVVDAFFSSRGIGSSHGWSGGICCFVFRSWCACFVFFLVYFLVFFCFFPAVYVFTLFRFWVSSCVYF
jgi:hypothetical protein